MQRSSKVRGNFQENMSPAFIRNTHRRTSPDGIVVKIGNFVIKKSL